MKRSILYLSFAALVLSGCGARARSARVLSADTTAVTFNLSFEKAQATRLRLIPLKTMVPAASLALDSTKTRHDVSVKLTESTRDAFAAIVDISGGGIASARIPEGTYRKGEVHEWKLEMAEPSVAVGKSPQHIQQMLLNIQAGQYSGITRMGDDTYAVVHDKASGGGLYIFTVNIRADGTVASVQSFETDAGGPSGRDNEDVVYVPETKTLFVSAEGDQTIREYRTDGRETGRQLSVPEDLKSIKSNAGFEALGYGNGTFWTTTEAPLPGEILPRLHRIQSFSLKDLQPRDRYLYLSGEPAVSEAEAASAQAYVFGISAMTVLPDGRLAVLEREVYVPGSGLFAKLAGSFTENSIYLVDPAHCTAGILEKTLLTRFRTSALTLANFEGMCLGPKMADGRQTLLLIADSQGGSGGLTGEYLRVIALP